jgi:hypothetical protein
MTKTVFQLIIITLSRTAKILAKEAHAVLYMMVVILYFTLSTRIKLYNYDRFALWQSAIHLCFIWFSVIALCNLFIAEKTALLVLLLVGITAIFLVAFLIQLRGTRRGTKYR